MTIISRLRWWILACDLAWLAIAVGMSWVLRYGFNPTPDPQYTSLLAVAAGVWAILFTTTSLDCFEGGWRLHVTVARVLRATVVLVVLTLALAYLARIYYSRLLLIYFGVLLLLGFLFVRLAFYVYLRGRHEKGYARRVVLVGNERFAREFTFKIRRHPELLYKVVGTLNPVVAGVPVSNGDSDGRPFLGDRTLSSFDVLRSFSERRVDEIVILQEEPSGLEFESFVARCRSMGVRVSVLPRGYDLYTSKPRLTEIEGLPLISLESPSRLRPHEVALKRGMDLLIGALLLPPAIAVFVISAAVLMWNRRKVLRRELRVGKDGKAFWMYRLDIDRQSDSGPAYERVMRNLSISEIPQLLNVFIGEMSLVGPRPESPERVKHYSEWQKERLKVKPGVTGLAQVNGLREHHGSEEKTRFDLQYLLERSPFNDLVLIMQTIGTLIGRSLPALREDGSADSGIQTSSAPMRSKSDDEPKGAAPDPTRNSLLPTSQS